MKFRHKGGLKPELTNAVCPLNASPLINWKEKGLSLYAGTDVKDAYFRPVYPETTVGTTTYSVCAAHLTILSGLDNYLAVRVRWNGDKKSE